MKTKLNTYVTRLRTITNPINPLKCFDFAITHISHRPQLEYTRDLLGTSLQWVKHKCT